MTETTDFIVIGGGIAGVSAAAELAANARVILLEQEPQPGYHATGRSAAFLSPSYGTAVARAVTARSEPFYLSPPAGFTETPLLHPRPYLLFARPDQRDVLLARQQAQPSLRRLTPAEVQERVPILLAERLEGGLLDERGGDLDVDAILQGFLRSLRRRGGEVRPRREVLNLSRNQGLWTVAAAEETLAAPVVVNAGGAWADDIAQRAGLAPLGLQPLRRTALLFAPPEGCDVSDWPVTVNIEEEFYFKPDAGAVLLSPCDETPTPPCDAQPEELDVAQGVARYEQAVSHRVDRITHRWAGLRTFAPDRTFVVGPDPRAEGFFWLAGQGGSGVQTAPVLAGLTAFLLTGASPRGDTAADRTLAGQLAPDRLLP